MYNKEYIERLVDSANSIAIYGAGIVAQNTYLLVKQAFKKEFKFFLVSHYDENDSKLRMTSAMYGEPIRAIDEVKLEKETLVIIAVSEKYRQDIENHLDGIGHEKRLFLDYELRNYMFSEYYQAYFDEKWKETEWVVAGQCQGKDVWIKNPFLVKKRNQNSCFSELGTIILPACYDDLRLSSETPYEFGEVNLNVFSEGCVLDLGANQGYFSALAAALGHQVYAFEPSRALIDNLRDYQLKYGEKIEVVEAAVGDYCGEGQLFIDAFSDDANSMVLKTNAEKTEKVDVITIDEFVKKKGIEKVDFIKADIEGAERNMLKGATWVLKNHKPFLSICTYHLSDDPEVISRIILEANPEYVIVQKEKKLYGYVK